MRLNRKTAVVIAVACVLGALLLLVLYRMSASGSKSQQAVPAKVMVPVVIATTEIPRHTIITAGMVTVKQVDDSQKPDGALGTIGDAVDHVSREHIAANQAVLTNQLEPRDGANLAYSVPPGMRAVTIATDAVSGVAGFLKPGDRVDVMVTFDRKDGGVAKCILQDVQLLAIDDRTALDTVPHDNQAKSSGDAKKDSGSSGEKPKVQAGATATLAVALSQVPRLKLASAKGSLCLALRSPDDHVLQPVPVADTLQLIGIPPPPPGQPVAPMPSPGAGKVTAGMPGPTAADAQAAQAAQAAKQAQLTRERSVEVIRGDQTQTVVP